MLVSEDHNGDSYSTQSVLSRSSVTGVMRKLPQGLEIGHYEGGNNIICSNPRRLAGQSNHAKL